MPIDINQPANPEAIRELVKPMKMPSYMRRPIDIDLEPEEPEADLEFKVVTFDFSPARSVAGVIGITERNKKIEDLLSTGWQLDNQIVCPPSVTLIFSREKEEKETTENGE